MKAYWPLDANKLTTEKRCYLLSGAEELLLEESYRSVIAFAKQKGFIEHHRLYGAEDLNVSRLDSLIINRGLFSEGTLIDIRLPEGKTGRTGAKVLQDTFDKIIKNKHTFLIITASSSKGKLAAKWVDRVEAVGEHILHPVLNDSRKRQWLSQRLQKANITIESQGQAFLLVITEGNFLALEQQVKQLEIAGIDGITLEELRKRFQDEARFNLFSLPERIFNGQATKALRMCRRLRQEGEPLVLLVWAVINELNLGIQLAELQKQNESPSAFFRQNRIWKERESLLYQIAQRGLTDLSNKAQQLHHIDKQSKGQAFGDGWLSLENFISQLAVYGNKK